MALHTEERLDRGLATDPGAGMHPACAGVPGSILDRVLENPEAPPSQRRYDWNRLAEDTDEVLEVQVDTEGEETEYYLLTREAPSNAPVETITAKSAIGAATAFLLGNIQAQIPVPPWKNGEPQRHPDPELQAVIGEEGEYLVGEADWPDGTEMTHGTLWATFTPPERGYVEKLWVFLDKDPRNRPQPPRWPP